MPTGSGEGSPAASATTLHLFIKYAAILLVPILTLSVVLSLALRSEEQQRGLDQAESGATLLAQTAIEPLLSGAPLGPHLGSHELSALRQLVAVAVKEHDILRLRLHDLQGKVVFSYDGSAASGKPNDGDLAAGAGRTVAKLTHLNPAGTGRAAVEIYEPLYAGPQQGRVGVVLSYPNSGRAESGRSGSAAVEIYEPLYAGPNQKRVGVLELYLPYGPIKADVTASMHRLMMGLVAAMVLLYLALLAITVSVSRGLRRQVAVNAAQAERLRISERDHRLLFEGNPQPMIAYDQETLEIVAVSDAAIANYGYTREEFLAMKIQDVHPAADAAALLRHFESVRQRSRRGFSTGWQTRHQYKDGTIVDIEVSSDDVMLRGRKLRMALCQDVTERNRTMSELAIARDEAIEASNTKSAFLANVSHEIRTPMNGVLGMTEVLLGTELDEEQRGYAEQVSSSGEHMLTIINDILDISKIETGQLELDLTNFTLHDALDQACAPGAVSARAKDVGFALQIADDVPRDVRADRGRLRQIVLNLVVNAVKFTSQGDVTVSVVCLRRSDHSALLRIEVKDDGIGIAPDRLEQMFEPFTQADVSTTRKYGGTGLGLAIARELTELMGGTIGAESDTGQGSTFWVEVELELAAEGAGDVAETLIADRPGELPEDSPIVLVVDDTPVNQIVAVRALQRCGCRAEVAGDGHQALVALATTRFDAVLMDCQMPEMDGYAATTELRQREAGGRRTPVIAMTASAMKGDFERCMAHGMDDFVSKPLRHNVLGQVLRRWIPRLAAREERVEPAAAA